MLITKQFEATTETEIIKRIKEGEIDLFEILVRRNNPFLYKIGMSYGYSHQNVEDLMQEAFIAAYLNLNKFEQRSSFKTWITKIMLNQCYHKAQRMSFKKEKTASTNSEKTISDFENLQSVDGFKKIISRELSHVIEDAIIHMPLDYRMVLSLRELNGMSTAEAAEVLDISEENVKVRLNRAKQLLKQRLEKIYEPKEIFEFNLVYCDAIVYRVMKAITARS